jgi:hypothetical protein
MITLVVFFRPNPSVRNILCPKSTIHNCHQLALPIAHALQHMFMIGVDSATSVFLFSFFSGRTCVSLSL